jgi:hypothetical protein
MTNDSFVRKLMKPDYTSYEVSNYEQSSRDFLHAFVVSLFQQLGDNSNQSEFVCFTKNTKTSLNPRPWQFLTLEDTHA